VTDRNHLVPKTMPSRPTGRRGASVRLAALLVACAGLALAAPSAASAASGNSSQISSPYGPVYEHISYGSRFRQVLDVFASATPNSPIVVLVHGGGWRYYDPLTRFAAEAEALQQLGYTVLDINYDQDNERVPAFPLEPDDVIKAIDWGIANAATYNGDPTNVILLGGSAGGHLVAIAGEMLDKTSPGTIRAIISLSGPMNLTTLLAMVEENAITNEEFVTSIQQALGMGPGEEASPETESYAATWSPALHIPPAADCPDWLIFSSEQDLVPVSQAQEMYADLQRANCKATLDVVPGSGHAFAYFNSVRGVIDLFLRGE